MRLCNNLAELSLLLHSDNFGGQRSTYRWRLFRVAIPSIRICQRSLSAPWVSEITSAMAKMFFSCAKSTQLLSMNSNYLRVPRIPWSRGAVAWSSPGNHELVRTSSQPLSSLLTIATQFPGKTCFLYYLLFVLLSEQKTVAFQVTSHFILFQDTGIRLLDCYSFAGKAIPPGTWALTDFHPDSVTPCQAFVNASNAGRAWIV